MRTKITIGIPCNRVIKPATMQSLLDMIAFSDYDYQFIVATEGYTIAENRAYIAVQAQRNKSDYLLFIDDDMVFPKDTLETLIGHEKEVIGVPYYSRMLPRKSVVVLENGKVLKGEVPSELFKCQHVGTGIMLIKMDVFDKIDKPWFKFVNHESGFTEMGEDAWFCKQAREKGVDIWCDSTITIKHLGDIEY